MAAGIALYREKLGFTLELEETVKEHGVLVSFLSLADCTIELLSPLTSLSIDPSIGLFIGPAVGEAASDVGKFLAKRGEGLHHLCFRVPSLTEEIERLAKSGMEFVNPIPRAGSRGTRVVFIRPRSSNGALIELCEST